LMTEYKTVDAMFQISSVSIDLQLEEVYFGAKFP
jgi:hypothetical protein